MTNEPYQEGEETSMATRRPLMAGNWKLNKTPEEAAAFVREFAQMVGDAPDAEVVLAPTALAISESVRAAQGSAITIAAQNVYPKPSGAFTGEVSAPMLKAAGVGYCIIGHSERRQYFHESDAMIREKLEALLAASIRPILCLGESLEEREAGATFDRIGHQLRCGLEGLSESELSHVVVAYEPIWAIGTGKTATPEQAQEAHAFLRSQIAALSTQASADATRILYGGSVKPANVKTLMGQADIDGALVGGASLKTESFLAIANFAS